MVQMDDASMYWTVSVQQCTCVAGGISVLIIPALLTVKHVACPTELALVGRFSLAD